jgi:hypothetical protein
MEPLDTLAGVEWAQGFYLGWFVREVLLGLVFATLMVWFHGVMLGRIHIRYTLKNKRSLKIGHINRVFIRFYVSIFLILLVHFAEIVLGAASFLIFGVEKTLIRALIMAGSTYTTVGFASDAMPAGWKLYPLFLAITGLFNFAWSTGVMMNMTNQYRTAMLRKLHMDALPELGATSDTD